MSSAPALEVADLHVYLGESHVLQGVSFSVATEGVTALLGRNGVGKTTTLRALMGLVPRSRGRVEIDGDDVTRLPTHAIVRRGVGYVPEDRDVFAGLTVDENLRLAVRGSNGRYDLVYELFPELRERGGQRAGTLSGGQQQMVAIARALLNDNALLLIDEPTKGLAPALVTDVAIALERAAELTTSCSWSRISASPSASHSTSSSSTAAGSFTKARPESSLRAPSGSNSSSASMERGIEHIRPAHDHGARARRDVLPGRLRVVAHLRADGRPQLRARRVYHLRRLCGVVATTQISSSYDGQLLAATALVSCRCRARGSSRSASSDRSTVVRSSRCWSRWVSRSAGGARLRDLGRRSEALPVPGWMLDTTTILGANIPNDRFVEIAVAAICSSASSRSCASRESG